MDWTDEGIVLSARRHGESSAVVQMLTRDHGRHAGLVRGVGSTRNRGLFETGNRVTVHWRARLSEHLGQYQCELLHPYSASWFDDRLRLAAISAACAQAEAALPEREPHPAVYDALVTLMDMLPGDVWGAAYVRWEIGLLGELGYGLDLSACAATGSNDNLTYVSPNSGRAVSSCAGEPYRDRLLALPGFLVGHGGGGTEEILAGLALTAFFLRRHVFGPANRDLPPARLRLVDCLEQVSTISSGCPET